jgi:hypothetical protein
MIAQIHAVMLALFRRISLRIPQSVIDLETYPSLSGANVTRRAEDACHTRFASPKSSADRREVAEITSAAEHRCRLERCRVCRSAIGGTVAATATALGEVVVAYRA